MKTNLISIIIPIYNCEDYIEKCIRSVLSQDYRNWELLLINDGSKDNSGIICQKYSQSDSRIRYIEKDNEGVSIARNIGIDEARGKWLVFIDSDDLVSPEYLRHLIEDNSDDIYTHTIQGFKCIDKDDSLRKWMDIDYNGEQFNVTEIEPYLIKYNLINRVQVWGKLFSTEIIRNNNLYFDKNISLGEDGIFSHKYLLLSKRIKLSGYSDYLYRNPYLLEKDNLTKKIKTINELYNLSLIYKELSIDLIERLNIHEKSERNKSMSFYITNLRLLLKHKELLESYSANSLYKLLGNFKYYKPQNIKDYIFKILCIAKKIKLINYLYARA